MGRPNSVPKSFVLGGTIDVGTKRGTARFCGLVEPDNCKSAGIDAEEVSVGPRLADGTIASVAGGWLLATGDDGNGGDLWDELVGEAGWGGRANEERLHKSTDNNEAQDSAEVDDAATAHRGRRMEGKDEFEEEICAEWDEGGDERLDDFPDWFELSTAEVFERSGDDDGDRLLEDDLSEEDNDGEEDDVLTHGDTERAGEQISQLTGVRLSQRRVSTDLFSAW